MTSLLSSSRSVIAATSTADLVRRTVALSGRSASNASARSAAVGGSAISVSRHHLSFPSSLLERVEPSQSANL